MSEVLDRVIAELEVVERGGVPEGAFTAADVAAQKGQSVYVVASHLQKLVKSGALKRQLASSKTKSAMYWYADEG